ncbi:MAG TPA: type II toxin-antitoxin system RelE/ParE family toxin [Candidatus Bathyarchaeia archaeon]|nr:type II toxin-antitoxin system RelE/ParE family toxin [Candidatus Bathyarchaeia archaeon]
MRGEFENGLSLRIGDYRIIYTVIEREKRVVLLTVGHRSKVYD